MKWTVGMPRRRAASQVATFTFSTLTVANMSGRSRLISFRILKKARGLKFSRRCQTILTRAEWGFQ